MENEIILRELKTEFYKEVDDLRRKHKSFKKRITSSQICNIFINYTF
jgi:hypothetical protein